MSQLTRTQLQNLLADIGEINLNRYILKEAEIHPLLRFCKNDEFDIFNLRVDDSGTVNWTVVSNYNKLDMSLPVKDFMSRVILGGL